MNNVESESVKSVAELGKREKGGSFVAILAIVAIIALLGIGGYFMTQGGSPESTSSQLEQSADQTGESNTAENHLNVSF